MLVQNLPYVKHPCAFPCVSRSLRVTLLKVTREVLQEEVARVQERGVVNDLRAKVDHLILGAHKDGLEPLMDDKPAPRMLPT